MAHICIYPRCPETCSDCNYAQPPQRWKLDDLLKLRNEAMAAGPGSGPWIKAAQALMDAFPDFYATARGMNAAAKEMRSRLRMLENPGETP